MSNDEEMAQVVVNVPRSAKDSAMEKLEYGQMTEEIRDLVTRIAFGEDLGQRSRLERQLEDLRDRRDELRRERRSLDAEIENIDSRIDGVEKRISQLSSQEERYEAKLESLEHRLRAEGRLFPEHSAVREVAKEAEREPEGVIEDLKGRNPDVPEYAFEEMTPYVDEPKWHGFEDEEKIQLAVGEREARYR